MCSDQSWHYIESWIPDVCYSSNPSHVVITVCLTWNARLLVEPLLTEGKGSLHYSSSDLFQSLHFLQETRKENWWQNQEEKEIVMIVSCYSCTFLVIVFLDMFPFLILVVVALLQEKMLEKRDTEDDGISRWSLPSKKERKKRRTTRTTIISIIIKKLSRLMSHDLCPQDSRQQLIANAVVQEKVLLSSSSCYPKAMRSLKKMMERLLFF